MNSSKFRHWWNLPHSRFSCPAMEGLPAFSEEYLFPIAWEKEGKENQNPLLLRLYNRLLRRPPNRILFNLHEIPLIPRRRENNLNSLQGPNIKLLPSLGRRNPEPLQELAQSRNPIQHW